MQNYEGEPMQEVPYIINSRNRIMINRQNALLVLLYDTVSFFANFSIVIAMCAKPPHIVKKEFQLLRSAALIQGNLEASSFPSLV
jgi:hypothetical protein